MRTTLNIDDDALDAVRRLAEAHALPVGRAASLLIQRGVKYGPPIKFRQGFPVVDADAPTIRGEDVRKAEDAAW